MTYRIVIDRALCSGFGECTNLAPESFRLESDGTAVVTADLTHDDRVREAAAACPMAAIQVLEADAA